MKRNYNNLFESILTTILLNFYFGFYCFSIYSGVIRAREGTNLVVTFIVCTLIFFGGTIILFGMLIWDGYSYWNVDENRILYKRFLRKKIIIPLSAEFKVEKKTKSAFIMYEGYTDAYFIEFNNQKAIIYINEKNEDYLEGLFGKYIIQ